MALRARAFSVLCPWKNYSVATNKGNAEEYLEVGGDDSAKQFADVCVDGITITQEMKRAGARVVIQLDPSFESEYETAARVYLAMEKVRPNGPRRIGIALSLSPQTDEPLLRG